MTTSARMGVGVLLAGLLAAPAAGAQYSNVRRSGSPRVNEGGTTGTELRSTQPIGLRDCESEVWTLSVSYPGEGMTVTSIQHWVGAEAMSCSTMTARMPPTPTCWRIEDRTISNPPIPYNATDYRIPARYLVDPVGGNCRSPQTPRGTVATNQLSLLVQTSNLNMYGMPLAVSFDLAPPDPASNVTAVPGENAATVSWSYASATSGTTTTDAGTTTTTDDSGTTTSSVPMDLQGFWILCDPPARGASDAGAADAGSDAAVDAGPDAPDETFGEDGGSASCGQSFPSIDPNDDAVFERYRYSALLNPASTEGTVTGLANGRSYRCVVVAQDTAGNRSISQPSRCVTPVPVTDFWERYRQDGGGARPADCAARPAPGGDASAAVALSLAAAALVLRRRRNP